MKRIALATTEETLSDVMKDQIIMLANEYDGQIVDIIRYPEMFMLIKTDVVAHTLRKLKPDYVFFTDHDCLLSEINLNFRLSDEMDKVGIKLIDVHTGEEIRKVIEKMPLSTINYLKKDEYKLSNTVKYEEDNQKNILLICNKNVDQEEISETLVTENINMLINMTFNDFEKGMCKDIEEIIDIYHISKIIVFNDINSIEFNEFMDFLEKKGISIQHRETTKQELKMQIIYN